MARSRALAWASDFLHPLPPRTRGGKPRLQRGHPPHHADRRAPRGGGLQRPAVPDRQPHRGHAAVERLPRAASPSITSSSTTASSTSFATRTTSSTCRRARTAPTPERARRLDIRSLTLNGLDVQYEDKFRNWGVKVPRIESDAARHRARREGQFRRARQRSSFRLRDRTMTMSPFETVMTFDGSNVALEQARLSSSEIEAFLSGDDQARPRFAVARSRAQGQRSISTRRSSGCRRRPCR